MSDELGDMVRNELEDLRIRVCRLESVVEPLGRAALTVMLDGFVPHEMAQVLADDANSVLRERLEEVLELADKYRRKDATARKRRGKR